MNGLLWNFALGLIVSFLGTLPLGVLNITIIRISIKRGLRAAFQFAVACALVELVYSYIAVRITLLLIHGATFKLVTEVISVFTLALLGCYYLRKNTAPKGSTQEIGAFFLGSTLSIVNVIAHPCTCPQSAQNWLVNWSHILLLLSFGLLLDVLSFLGGGLSFFYFLNASMNRLFTHPKQGGYIVDAAMA